MQIADKNITTEEVVKRWRNGDIVFSVELGGVGPGYEQAIQITLFTILGYWLDKKIDPDTLVRDKKSTEECENDLAKLLEKKDLTMAMYGAARNTAWQFLKYGYSEIMKKCPDDRLIQVSKKFPK